jgi:hypothetical protein
MGMGGVRQPQQPGGAAGQKGIDPDSVPDPITVNVKNQEEFSKPGRTTYSTVSEDNPPLVGTKVAIQDDGNASPRVMRSTLYVCSGCNPRMRLRLPLPLPHVRCAVL